jgi:integrase
LPIVSAVGVWMAYHQAPRRRDMEFLAEVLRTARAYWQIPFHGDPVGDARMILNRLHLIGRPRERRRRPTADESQRLRGLWNGNPRQTIPMANIMDFAIASAWRLGEITRVTWTDFDTKKKTIIIRDRKDPREKEGNDQEVPVFPDMMKIIKRHEKTDDQIFPYNERSISTAFTRACQKLKIDNLHFHDLRHEGTSRLFEAKDKDGKPVYGIPEVALCTGHKDWKMLARYTQLNATDLHRD